MFSNKLSIINQSIYVLNRQFFSNTLLLSDDAPSRHKEPLLAALSNRHEPFICCTCFLLLIYRKTTANSNVRSLCILLVKTSNIIWETQWYNVSDRKCICAWSCGSEFNLLYRLQMWGTAWGHKVLASV